MPANLRWIKGSHQREPEDTGSGIRVLRVEPDVFGKRNHEYKYAKPSWDYTFTPLTIVSENIYNQLTVEGFITTLMLTLSPPPLSESTGFNAIGTHEKVVMRVINQYKRETGLMLPCAGFVAAGHNGHGRAEAHLVFQKRPDMIALKRICLGWFLVQVVWW